MKAVELGDALLLALSDIGFSGLSHTPPAAMERLDELGRWMSELGMVRGAGLAAEFKDAMGAYHRGECPVSRPADLLCALEFYDRYLLAAQEEMPDPEPSEENPEEETGS